VRADTSAPPLYHSARTYTFQVDGTARAYFRSDNLAIWSTGLGKGHLAMALSALLFEDDLIDLVVVVCESDKIGEWIADYGHFTRLSAQRYAGTPAQRRAIAAEMPTQVLVGTYEIMRNDLACKRPGKPRALDDGFLVTALRRHRVLVVYDEITKIKNRSSATYRHHEHALRRLRKTPGAVRTLGLTATGIERDPENLFDIGRLIHPGIGTVAQFERDHVLARDEYGNPVAFINVGEADRTDPWVQTLHQKLSPVLLVKDKFDDDVRAEFPHQVEEFDYLTVEGTLRELYDVILGLDDDEGGMGGMAQATVLRQILLHPLSLTRSQGGLAQHIVAEVGEGGLAAIPTPRVERLLVHLERLVKSEGRQALVFSFFGQSVLPILKPLLEAEGYRISLNIGSMSRADRDESKARFKAGEADIFLSSDAGSRGINLPEATAVLNYELPILASTYQQRIDRVHRIDSDEPVVLARSMIAKDTIEEGIAAKVLDRNEWFDTFHEAGLAAGTINPYRPTAEERRLLMRIARDTTEETTEP
jgi:SNF2 family DNA or RNA helicase